MMAAPTMSNRRGSSWSLGANAQSRPTETTAIGGLIQNTACQPNVSVNQPPKTGPAAVVNDEAAAHTAIARLRSVLGYVAPIKARLAGVSSAAAVPCKITGGNKPRVRRRQSASDRCGTEHQAANRQHARLAMGIGQRAAD